MPNSGNRRRGQAQKAASLSALEAPNVTLNPGNILGTIASLYADELKPVSHVIRKRLLERTGIEAVRMEQLHDACMACEFLKLEPSVEGDWAAQLLDRPPKFVEISSMEDTYPSEMWEALAEYWNGPGNRMFLRGRYAYAQELQRLQLPFFEDRSLGQLCHIVQLALSQKKLLGFYDGGIAPYTRSASMRKECCALFRQPVRGISKGLATLPVATWGESRACLQEILQSSGGEVPLANVKRLFRTRFSLELSETAFGHSRVSDFLRDARLQDICRLDLQSNGYVVVDAKPSDPMAIDANASDPSVGGCADNIGVPLRVELPFTQSLSPQGDIDGPCRVQTACCSDEPLSLEDAVALAENEPVRVVPAHLPEKVAMLSPPSAGQLERSSEDNKLIWPMPLLQAMLVEAKEWSFEGHEESSVFHAAESLAEHVLKDDVAYMPAWHPLNNGYWLAHHSALQGLLKQQAAVATESVLQSLSNSATSKMTSSVSAQDAAVSGPSGQLDAWLPSGKGDGKGFDTLHQAVLDPSGMPLEETGASGQEIRFAQC